MLEYWNNGFWETGKMGYCDNSSWTRKTISLINELLHFKIKMNYPAASGGVSLKTLKRPKGRGIDPGYAINCRISETFNYLSILRGLTLKVSKINSLKITHSSKIS